MKSYSNLAVVLCVTAFVLNGRALSQAPPIDVQDTEQVRELFHSIDYDERVEQQIQQLIRMGEKAFPAYEKILKDPKAASLEISGVLILLRRVQADRRPFLRHAVSRLADKEKYVRLSAVTLLKQIGSPAEASPVVALLSDEFKPVIYMAGKTLSAIGGPNEIVAMDVWLRGVSHRDDRQLREHVQKCRDELKKRLAEKKDPTK